MRKEKNKDRNNRTWDTFLPFKKIKNFKWTDQNNKIKSFLRNGISICINIYTHFLP